MADLDIDSRLSVSDRWLEERFIRASGPGGQNVNKVASAVELRFDLDGCEDLGGAVKTRLRRIAGRRLNDAGVIVLRAEQHRSQDMNRSDARNRLAGMIRAALRPPKARIATKPSRAAKRRRLEAKARRGAVKALRSSKPEV